MAIGIGILGTGRVVNDIHLPQLMALKAWNIVGVHDISAERAAQAAARCGAQVFPSYEAMLADPRVEVVTIATPSNLHADFAIQSLEAGKHVVVDKPTATSLEQVETMLAAAKRCGRVLTTYQNRRWDADYLEVRKALAGDLIGAPWLIESRILGCGDTGWGEYGLFGDRWRLQKAWGGGYLLDWGPHVLDQVLQLVSAPVHSVFADIRGGIWSKDADDHFMIVIRFANGVVANCMASAVVRLEVLRWLVAGSNGTLEQRGWGAPIRIAYHKGGKLVETTFAQGQSEWERFYANLAEALAGTAELAVTPEHTRRLFQVIEAARESARTGESVRPAK
jgi:scyllo-inositol 2-dehydrogenase (NADP+)